MSSRDDSRIAAIGEVPSPLGPIRLAATPEGLAAAVFSEWRGEWAGAAPASDQDPSRTSAAEAVIVAATQALSEYFQGSGEVQSMPSFDLAGTDLQVAVWQELSRIPVGVTRTYSEIAAAVGRPTAVRAVAAAIGANPVGVLVPCHRVVGADGSLTGYAGGLERKTWLLAHEGAALAV